MRQPWAARREDRLATGSRGSRRTHDKEGVRSAARGRREAACLSCCCACDSLHGRLWAGRGTGRRRHLETIPLALTPPPSRRPHGDRAPQRGRLGFVQTMISCLECPRTVQASPTEFRPSRRALIRWISLRLLPRSVTATILAICRGVAQKLVLKSFGRPMPPDYFPGACARPTLLRPLSCSLDPVHGSATAVVYAGPRLPGWLSPSSSGCSLHAGTVPSEAIGVASCSTESIAHPVGHRKLLQAADLTLYCSARSDGPDADPCGASSGGQLQAIATSDHHGRQVPRRLLPHSAADVLACRMGWSIAQTSSW